MEDIEIIAGQDHFYWLYSNSRDKYAELLFRTADTTEDEVRRAIQTIDLTNLIWYVPDFDI